MATLLRKDFFYGAFLSSMVQQRVIPALIESHDDWRLYRITTKKGKYDVLAKYLVKEQNKRYRKHSWRFDITDNETSMIEEYYKGKKEHPLLLALVCTNKTEMHKSELALLNMEEISEVLGLHREIERNYFIGVIKEKRARSLHIYGNEKVKEYPLKIKKSVEF